MAHLKRFLMFAMSGAVLGAVITSLIAPSFLISANSTRLASQCSCVDVTRDTAETLIRWQLTGAGIGAGALLVLALILALKGRARPAPSPTAPGGV